MNLNNTPEGEIVRKKYADILPLSRPEPIKPRMATLNRAKIFSPFAALRGYDEEISDQDRVLELIAKAELSDEDKEQLSDALLQVRKGMTITVRYFHADTVYAPLGTYESLTGTVAEIDPVYREIDIRTGTTKALEKSPRVTISFDDLIQVTGDGIVGVDDFLGLEEYPGED